MANCEMQKQKKTADTKSLIENRRDSRGMVVEEKKKGFGCSDMW